MMTTTRLSKLSTNTVETPTFLLRPETVTGTFPILMIDDDDEDDNHLSQDLHVVSLLPGSVVGQAVVMKKTAQLQKCECEITMMMTSGYHCFSATMMMAEHVMRASEDYHNG